MINTIDHIINIDLVNKINMNNSINIKQNDTNSHNFIINLFNNSTSHVLTGTTSRIYFKKTDGTNVFLDCVLDDSITNKLSVLLTTQTLTSIGSVACEITTYGTNGEIQTSFTFNFNVLENIRDDGAIESASEFTALTNALSVVTGINNKAEKSDLALVVADLENIPQQLAPKLSKADVQSLIGFLDINKNLSQIDATMLTPTLLAQIAGTAGVNVTPSALSVLTTMLANLSVTGEKTNFLAINTLFNTLTVTLSKFLSATNTLTDATYNVTDYIPIDATKTYEVNYHRLTCYYDANKTFISAQDTGTSSTLVVQNLVIPSTAVYLRTNISQALYGNYYICKAETKYKLGSNIKNSVISATDIPFIAKYNFIDDIVLNNGLFLQNDGTSIASEFYTTSDFVPVKEVSKYEASTHRRTVYFDVDEVVLGYFDSSVPTHIATEISTPVGCAFIKTTIPLAELTGYYLNAKSYEKFVLKDEIVIPQNTVTPSVLSRFIDLILCTVGDSITWLNGYQPILKSQIGLGTVVNQGNSGWSMLNIYNQYANGGDSYKTNIDLADIVTLFTCTNDYQLATPLGVVTSFDTTTFCGVVNAFIRDVVTARPTRPLLLIATPQRRGLGVWNTEHTVETYDANVQVNSLGLYLKDYVDAYVTIAKSKGMPVLNLSEVGGFNKYNIDSVTLDGLHPNPTVGMPMLGYKIAEFINNFA